MDQPIHPIVRFAVQRRVTMSMLLLGLLVMGWLALERLPLEYLPTISSSNVSVTVPYASSSPEEIERLIVRPLEDSLGTLNRLDTLSARASSQEARLDISFADGTDMDMAAVEVRDRVDRVRHLLPSDIQQVRIRRFQTSDIPVLRFHLAATWPSDQLYDYAERVLQRRLERLDGVGQVSLRGLRNRQVHVDLSAERMEAHGVDLRELSSTLRRNHLNLSAGDVKEGRRKLLVRVLGELTTLEEIRRLPLGEGVRLGDVARVSYSFPEKEEYNFLNGSEAMTVRIYKTSSANLLEVVDRVKAELALLMTEPEAAGLSHRIYNDASLDVRKGLGQLRDAGVVGGGLAILAVFLFLRRWRTTLLVGIAIPVSVVFTFVLMYLLRQLAGLELTLNVVSLMGLVLALGMLVDNSIVVIESIYRHVQEGKEDPQEAALHGASEVALPILASTATTLCVFIPVIFLRSSGGGFFSHYLKEVGTTVCIVMVASLLVALTVVPMVAALLLGREAPRHRPVLEGLGRAYRRGLSWTLKHRVVFFVLIAGLLWWSWKSFLDIERTFGSRTVPRQVSVYVDPPRSYDLEQVRALFEEIVARIDAQKQSLDLADVVYSFRAGGGRSRGSDRDRKIDIFLKDEDESRLTTTEVRDKIRGLLPRRPGVELRIAQSQPRHGSSGIEVQLSGDSMAVLERLGKAAAARLEELPFLTDVDLSLDSGDDEVRVQVARQRALQAGLSSQDVAQTVQGALSERAVSYLKTGEREVDLIMQYREEDRETLDQLRKVPLRSATEEGGADLPLDALADFEIAAGPSSILRENRRSRITISANSASSQMSRRSMGAVTGILSETPLPPGYEWSFGRRTRMSQQDQEGADFALIFAMILVYMLMAALFESFSHPLSIMLAIPFGFIGVGLVMKLASQPRDNFTELGLLILVGVVVNNAIVLIDRIGRLRRAGLERREAVLQGGQDRLRAILMTAITTILGLAPMVAPVVFPQWFGPLEGRAATWAPVGLVILGGLTTSTFLTLWVLPTIYTLVDDVARWIRRGLRAAAVPDGGEEPAHLSGEIPR